MTGRREAVRGTGVRVLVAPKILEGDASWERSQCGLPLSAEKQETKAAIRFWKLEALATPLSLDFIHHLMAKVDQSEAKFAN